MSIYDRQRVRELANEQLKKDLNDNEYEMTNEQFQNYWCVYQIYKHTYAKGIFKDWKFYFVDDIWDLLEENEIKYNDYCDYGLEEYVEEAKSEGIIDGFFELGDDLWIINNRGE